MFLIFANYLIESIGLPFDFFCLRGCGAHWIEAEIPSFLLTLLFQGSVKSKESLVPEQTVMYSKKPFVHKFKIPGVNGLIEFQSEAAKRDWKIMSVQHFEVTSNASAVDVNANLDLIKSIGNKIALHLHTL